MSHLAVAAAPYQPETDEELVAAHRRGDERAFPLLFKKYRTRIAAYSRRLVGRREVAEEICTDVFCKVLDGAWRPTGSFRSFLFTVAHRECLMHIRRRSTRVRLKDNIEPPLESIRPDESTERKRQAKQINYAMDQLPEQHRAVLLLYYSQELPSKEVATVLQCSDQQVRSKLSYARKLLRSELEKQGFAP